MVINVYVVDHKTFDREVETYEYEQSRKIGEEDKEDEQEEKEIDENNIRIDFLKNIYNIMVLIMHNYHVEYTVFRTAVIDSLKYLQECEIDTVNKTVKCKKCKEKYINTRI